MGLLGPSADQIVVEGSRTRGHIVGIETTYYRREGNQFQDDAYAVRLVDGETVGMRQKLEPADLVRLGMEVVVAVLDGAGFIDWVATGAEQGFEGETSDHRYKVLGKPPATGIVDELDALMAARRKGVPASLVIAGIANPARYAGLGMVGTMTVTVTVAGREPFSAELKRVEVPGYASHLARVGQVLPGLVVRRLRRERPVIDWPAAAMTDSGTGEPPALQSSGFASR